MDADNKDLAFGDFAADRKEYIASFTNGGIWKTAPVTEEPEILLSQWVIKHMVEGDFFVGTHVGRSGRVSTAIKTFDKDKLRGVTASGRVYELVGPGGYSSNGEYVWGAYKRVNGLTELDSTEDDD
jgi:hypothetical protein